MRIAGYVVVLAILIPALNLFITVTLLPSVVADIGGLALYAWATILYVVTSIVGAAGSSVLARRQGMRRGLVIASVVFGIGAAMCATAPAMGVIIAGRAVQGLGGGMIIGVVHATIRAVFPANEWPMMLARVSMAWGVAALTGPSVGAIFAQAGWWRGGFGVMIVLVAATSSLSWWLLPERRAPATAERFPGARLLLICAAVVSLGFVANVDGVVMRGALVVAMALALAWAFRLEDRAAKRLFPSGVLSARRPIGRCFWTIFLVAMSTTPIAVYFALLLQRIHDVSPGLAGYLFASHSLAWTVAAVMTTRVAERFIPVAIVLGPILMAIGFGGVALTVDRGPVSLILLAIVVEGFGIGTCWPHLGHAVFGAARTNEEEATAALIPSTQLFAGAFGGAICGIIASTTGLTRDASPAIASTTGAALFTTSMLLAAAAAVFAFGLARRSA